VLAEQWATNNKIRIQHFPSTSGNHLKRNIEMVAIADVVVAFWDGWSYGTAHTISHAVKKGIPVLIVEVTK
jgi:nucleoside 2-deoxyribosyltransferase